MYQKYWRYQIWKILILNEDCELMRMRVFEYAKFRVFEFSDYKISQLRHDSDRQNRGTKVYFTQLRSKYFHLRAKRTAFSPGMTLRASVSGEFLFFFSNFIWSEIEKIFGREFLKNFILLIEFSKILNFSDAKRRQRECEDRLKRMERERKDRKDRGE